MTLLTSSSYRAPWWLISPHLETIVPSLYRKVDTVTYTRETIDTPDGDFLDLDWLCSTNKRLVIISHGLEGNSNRHYMMGMARYFNEHNWDALAWNCRSCGGRMNNGPRLYHHAASEDLATVVDNALRKGYGQIALVGFSMGGSLSLKYLGEKSSSVSSAITGCAVFSVPCDLGSSSRALDKSSNAFYRRRFLKKLRAKLGQKAEQYPGLIDLTGIETIDSFTEFDNRYTAPIHGFKDAADFYHQGSGSIYLSSIRVPTLIANAWNDPMLPEECFPKEIVRDLHRIFLEVPKRGGHAGFTLAGKKENWMEVRALEFLQLLD